MLRSLELNFVLRQLPCSDAVGGVLDAELRCHYRVPHVRFVARTRVLCQTGRCLRAARARDDILEWLCEHAPLWVVVQVCALLRDP